MKLSKLLKGIISDLVGCFEFSISGCLILILNSYLDLVSQLWFIACRLSCFVNPQILPGQRGTQKYFE